MNQGLFESLTGRFIDGTPVDSLSATQRRVKSIMDHLSRLFNTRLGSVPHLRDYGVPDVSEIYRKGPDGIDELRSAIQRTIEKYEPRLMKVKVIQREAENKKDPRLMFILQGELLAGGGVVRFQTVFTSTGPSSIAPWKRPE